MHQIDSAMSQHALESFDSPTRGSTYKSQSAAQTSSLSAPSLPWDLVEPILIFATLHLGAAAGNAALVSPGNPVPDCLTTCSATALICASSGWPRTFLHLVYTRLLHVSPAVPYFTFSTAAAANRIDRLAFLYSVYGGDKPWHPCPSVADVLSPSQVQSAVASAFINTHLQVLDWLVGKFGASKVLGMINTPTAPSSPLIEATYRGKRRALEWWFDLARQADHERLSQVSFEVMEAAMRSGGAPMECLHWWVRDYLPHHSARSEAADLMFSYLQFCIESNQPMRVDWWIEEDPHLFTLALEFDSSRPFDYLTINEQLLLDSLLTSHFAMPDSGNTATPADPCSFVYIIDSPQFRPCFKRSLALSLVNRANAFSSVLTWWITQSATPFHLPDDTIDNLAATAHSEIDAFDALQTLADTCGYPLNESEVAMDLASEKGYDLLCEWWATYRGSATKYTHRALEQAVAKGMPLVVEFWLVSGLPLKWRGSILEWAAKYWVDGWTDEIRRLWREYGREVQGTVPWKDDVEEDRGL